MGSQRTALSLVLLMGACSPTPSNPIPPDSAVAPDSALALDLGMDRGPDACPDVCPDAGPDDRLDGGPSERDAAQDQGIGDAGLVDMSLPDFGPAPTEIIRPIPGELTIIQVDLPIGVTARLGEAAVIIGPAGSIALLDIGNSNHDDEMRALIESLNTQWLTPARGFSQRRRLQVEWIVLTHMHGDHAGAFDDLTSTDPIEITRGVVHRGFVDLGDGMNTSDFEEVCAALTGPLMALDRPLCVSAQAAPCSYAALLSPYPALDCPGLFDGELFDPSDDALDQPSYIDLDGARIELLGADTFMSDGTRAINAPPFGHEDTNQENARSIVGQIRFADFRYHFGGDLTGAGEPTEPDIESHFVQTSGTHAHGTLGVDVIHAHHHARRTSSNATLVDHLAPMDNRARNVIAGINAAHIGSPHAEVLQAWTANDRLFGGRFWVTTQAPTGADHPLLEISDGDIVVQTIGGGRSYRVQSSTLRSGAHVSVQASP